MSAGAAPRPPSAYVHGVEAPVAIVPGRVAARLDALMNLRRLRLDVRGHDPELDAVLVALGTAAAAWRATATGSTDPPEPEAAPSCAWLSTSQAAEALGISDRAVRLAIAQGRLDARSVAGRWRINRDDVEHYRAARTLRAA
ncbi:helix-turn-helix domain-containing protein [Streptomonospora sp. PA3]|uniref:helix-turn-helix domain-containing protein n=1 Tax=Streptomonospora sp. PA3 TaxID=2607326 RepID=UPI0012DD5DA1|nr:helix-turn-helix domain-containing protein [Streptomonospora sp. PA3]MUL39709.1 helix-turn-helix domain-containing protein [Streptomonospora sp. PA3]